MPGSPESSVAGALCVLRYVDARIYKIVERARILIAIIEEGDHE